MRAELDEQASAISIILPLGILECKLVALFLFDELAYQSNIELYRSIFITNLFIWLEYLSGER